ncbi:DUF4241 domain-containing protein [Actinomadura logoneensis]|uniref:DUF4241 domain-containing protein n=1 Tax=Actinomadura logoneensis TaxID=2293572 RepID=A0A372JK97_9ACTN|nr:DUF4241 domain-containing protein [Actinomadura logoneensis]RFU40452.1 DUF4241 domain-containing protein [Actinomadura logoneensis]
MLEMPDFEVMFQAGTRLRWKDGSQSTIDVRTVGELLLPSGRLIAQDPDVAEHEEPFSAPLPPGKYVVSLSISHWETSPNPGLPSPLRLVNAARIEIGDMPPVSWEMALRGNEDLTDLDEDGFFGFGVDSGCGAFFDVGALPYLKQMQPDDDSPLVKALDRLDEAGGLVVPTGDERLNIIVFQCGMGDGAYPTWIGRSENGDMVCLISDLELFTSCEVMPL